MRSRTWYVVAAAIFFAAIGGAAWIAISSIGGMGAGLFQVVVPGSADLELEAAGTYSILQVPARDGTSADISGLRITVHAANGTPVTVRSIAGANDTFGAGTNRSVLMCDIEAPGVYRFTAAYDNGRREPRAVLAVSGSLMGGMLQIMIALGIAVIGAFAAMVIAIVVFVRRRRALRGTTPPTASRA